MERFVKEPENQNSFIGFFSYNEGSNTNHLRNRLKCFFKWSKSLKYLDITLSKLMPSSISLLKEILPLSSSLKEIKVQHSDLDDFNLEFWSSCQYKDKIASLSWTVYDWEKFSKYRSYFSENAQASENYKRSSSMLMIFLLSNSSKIMRNSST